MQEISTRLERQCEASRVYGIQSTNATSYAYSTATTSQSPQAQFLSLTEHQTADIFQQFHIGRFKLPALKAVAMEAVICLHKSVRINYELI